MARRGRKAKPGRKEPNGRLSRRKADVAQRSADAFDREERDMLSVALEARTRVFGVNPQHTRDQMAGSVVGRLVLSGEMVPGDKHNVEGRLLYEAAKCYEADQWKLARMQPGPKLPGAVDLNRISGRSEAEPSPESIAYAEKIEARCRETRAALAEAQRMYGHRYKLSAALDVMVMMDEFVPHLIGDLRTALRVLVKRYGLRAGAEREAA